MEEKMPHSTDNSALNNDNGYRNMQLPTSVLNQAISLTFSENYSPVLQEIEMTNKRMENGDNKPEETENGGGSNVNIERSQCSTISSGNYDSLVLPEEKTESGCEKDEGKEYTENESSCSSLSYLVSDTDKSQFSESSYRHTYFQDVTAYRSKGEDTDMDSSNPFDLEQSQCSIISSMNDDSLVLPEKKIESGCEKDEEKEYKDNESSCRSLSFLISDTDKSQFSESSYGDTYSIDVTEYRTKRKSVADEEEDTDSNNPYMLMIKRNVAYNRDIIRSLGFLNGDANTRLCHPSPVVERGKRKMPPPRSKSLRLQGKRPSGELVSTERELERRARDRRGPLPMRSASGYDDAGICRNFFRDLAPHFTASSPANNCDVDSFKSSLKNLQLTPKRIAKVTLQRITSLAVHPSETKLIAVAGDSDGVIGFWDVMNTSRSRVQMLKPHTSPITCTSFCNYNPTVLYTTSYGGSVLRCDINRQVFDSFYTSAIEMNKFQTTWHCQKDAHTLMVVHSYGRVAFIDYRCIKSVVKFCNCDDMILKTVHAHPTREHLFVTASSSGAVKFWDARQLHKIEPVPVVSLKHPMGLKSAFFSTAGNYLLTTCNDSCLRVFRVTNINKPTEVVQTQFDINTGMTGNGLRAVWHPRREDVFVVGSGKHPALVEVYNNSGQVLHQLRGNTCVASLLYCCVFHPTKLAVLAANTSGKVHAFLTPDTYN